jgi:FdrA protein
VHTHAVIRRGTYHDSVKLMRVYAAARESPGVVDAACIMGTERNKETLRTSGLAVPEADAAGPDDLILVVRGVDGTAVSQALTLIEGMLAERPPSAALGGGPTSPRSLDAALRLSDGANLAFISVPGPYAAAEATRALLRGLHVHLFSDNVELDDEVALKRLGREHGLLVMGPDCGTALIGGVPLGFANAVARGPVGIVGASGTGIQEASVIIDRLGSGISHALGTGGRDLSDAVGGVMALMAIDLLEDDPDTRVILFLSKPPGARTAVRVQERLSRCRKPAVCCFVGGEMTLEEASAVAVSLGTGRQVAPFPRHEVAATAQREAARLGPGQTQIHGLYTGGTLLEEAAAVLRRTVGLQGHTLTDLGDDQFTRGRPHPMIDPALRAEHLGRAFADPSAAVVLCDVVLGYGAHHDPAGALASAVRRAGEAAGRYVSVVASVTGTPADPQNSHVQEETLRREGIVVLPTAALAAEVAGAIADRAAGRGKG